MPLRFSANLSMLFTNLPLIERFAAARAAGFEAAEIQFPYDVEAARLAAAAREAGVKIVLINAPIAAGLGRPGIACRPELEAEFLESLQTARDYAVALGVTQVNVLAGDASEEEKPRCLHVLAERLAEASEFLARDGVTALLEPANAIDRPGYAVHTSAEAARILDKAPGARLLFDIYHAATMGLDPAAEFKTHELRIGHVQFADAPGRHEPGTGRIDFARVFAAIERSTYRGWTGAEFTPQGDAPFGFLRRASRS